MTPAETRQALGTIKQQLQRTFRLVDGLLAALEEEPETRPTPQGCPHANTIATATLGNPGGQLCLDCNQMIP